MKILLITSKEEDYLQDSIIHGFKELFGNNALDYPVKSMLYDDYKDFNKIRGSGFTLYGLLDSNLKSKDIDIENDILQNKFDLIVFTSIYRQYDFFYTNIERIKKTHAVVWIMDGEDSPVLFPYLGKHLKQFLFFPKPHNNFIYFKREFLPETLRSIYFRLPLNFVHKFPYPKNVHPISFSIPQKKIISSQPLKTKLFTQHIVDKDVATELQGLKSTAVFASEKDYYDDIQKSKFGITTKRAGWDCLRHYEIAANGALICFRDLKAKPESCAPHGLIPGYNCISYNSYEDLTNSINSISDEAYETLLLRSLDWIRNQTTINRVKNLLSEFYKPLP
ncbi:MAG TPA: hypothetical protein VFW07_15850 [Parafilimonas sp.]|nr:hypothetical protein [Parafilimonas sp.]